MPRNLALLAVVSVAVCVSPRCVAKQPVDRAAEFRAAVDDLFANHRGAVAGKIENLKTGESFAWDAERAMPTASLIKLPVMIEAYRQADAGRLKLDEPITLAAEDKVPGSGILTNYFSPGVVMPLRDVIHLMIVHSDNTATNLVIDQIGLPATTAFTAEFGCPETRLHSKVYRRDLSIEPERSEKYGLGSTTSAEMVRLLKALRGGEIASSESCEAMLGHLRACEGTNKVRRFLPESTVVGNKTGAVSSSRTDAGVIESDAGPIAYCILTTDNQDRSWGSENEAELLAAEFGRLVFHYFNPTDDAPAAPVARVLSIGADGDLVASLQRTLNSHAKPGERIGVDGDFGPNTQRAVKRFQTAKGLEPTGRVDMDTWRALGPLLSEADVAPVDIDEVNSQELTTAKADPLVGPPTVTCAAYAIADGESGRVLWGYNDSTVRDPASVTKLMTAHLVTRAAEETPAILDETIVVSKAAEEVSGSSARIREGDRVSVKMALYGLMLPSGNDMSVAIAEHFGGRFSAEEDPESEGPVEAFIRCMNAEAARLGMTDTGYKNTHGLTAEGHHTTASDQTRLVLAAMASPVMREVVATRRLAVTLDSISGYKRNVVWSNSNRLLGIEGFDGVKTGTTGPAGACLASTGERDGQRLIVVVLGATSSDARYVDSRNLYRWAWRQLQAADHGG